MAITKHAWTFAGSGAFRVLGYSPLQVEIRDNPLAIGPADAPICHWHAAVFESLFGALVWPDLQVIEEHCTAMGAPACVFRIAPR